MFVDCRQKSCADKSKQTSTFLEMRYSNKLSFKKRELSFEHFLTYLSLSINGPSTNVYFRSPKGSQKIFLSSSRGWGCPFKIMFPEGHTKLAYFIKHVFTTYYVVKLQFYLAKFLMAQCQELLQAFCSDIVIM